MAQDYFALLGLTPGRYAPEEITRHYHRCRAQLLADLRDPTCQSASFRQLEELHVAHRTLRDLRRQSEYRRARAEGEDCAAELRRLIEASLEDGLLRYSRRAYILERAGELGFNEFQTQLMIAQVQFGDSEVELKPRRGARPEHPRVWARAAAVGVMALALFLGMVHWLTL